MTLLIMFDTSTIPITIEHCPRNRNTYIRIDHNGEIKVRTPLKGEASIRRILERRESWIRTKLETLKRSDGEKAVLGESIRFRGEKHPLEKFPHLQKNLEKARNSGEIEKYYHQFYRDEALLSLPSRVAFYARKMNLHPKEIRFKKMRRRWGSCDSLGVVTLNTMMMQLSYEQMDYIIVHELAHLSHMNHSKVFHDLVRLYLPEEKRLRGELRYISPLGC